MHLHVPADGIPAISSLIAMYLGQVIMEITGLPSVINAWLLELVLAPTIDY